MRAGSIGGGYGIPRFEDPKRWDVGHGDCTGLRDYRGQRSDCRGQIAEMGGRQKANNGRTKYFWNTNMYVQAVQRQQTKGVRGFLRGQKGLDKVCYGGRQLA